MKKENFIVQGMTCSSCSAHVEKAVKDLGGAVSVDVNLLLNTMAVEFDENELNENQIINAVKEAGYEARILVENNTEKSLVVQGTNTFDPFKSTITSIKYRLIISIVFLIPLIYLSMNRMFLDVFGLPIPDFIIKAFHGAENAVTLGVTELLLLLPIVYVNRSYFIIGFKRLVKLAPNMDSLVAIGSTSSILYGIFVIYICMYGLGHFDYELIQKYQMDLYFESAGMILTLITLGKFLETKSKGKTTEAIKKLARLVPKKASVVRGDRTEQVDIDNISVGDIIEIKPGNRIPVDGIVIEGSSYVNQASITGESVPVYKSVDSEVISGTINKNGYFRMKATKVGKNTTIAQIIKLVDEANHSKAQISKIADKVSYIFVELVIIIAAMASLAWIANGQSIEFALGIGISVLVISCPCALGLATPVAIMVGTGKGAENGILIKSAESLELLHEVDTIVLDKTGTITEGKLKVTDLLTVIDETQMLEIAASLESHSEHPLAEAILDAAKMRNLTLEHVDNFAAIPGRGIIGEIRGIEYYAGNLAFMQENNIETEEAEKLSEQFLNQGKTVLYFARRTDVIGLIAVCDIMKEKSIETVEEFKKRDLEVIMITGDNSVVADAIGKKVNLDKTISEVLPLDKEKEVEKLQAQGKKVAFVGDGINDGPALIKADVGIAIGSGTDIAIDSADVVLVRNNLYDVVRAIDLSKATINNIKVNLFWAFFYNCIGIPIACGLLYNIWEIKLNPMFGAVAMSLSSLCVVINALRLRRFKFKSADKNSMSQKVVGIRGMADNKDQINVEKALGSIDNVTDVVVSVDNSTAAIESVGSVDDETIRALIKSVGFEVIGIK